MDFDVVLKESGIKITGCVAVSLVGIDGIALSSYTKNDQSDLSLADAELATLATTAEKISREIGAGAMAEIILITGKMTIVTAMVGKEYYIYYALSGKEQNVGLARYEIKRLTQELSPVLYV